MILMNEKPGESKEEGEFDVYLGLFKKKNLSSLNIPYETRDIQKIEKEESEKEYEVWVRSNRVKELRELAKEISKTPKEDEPRQ